MRHTTALAGALLLAGLQAAAPARAGEDRVWTPALLDGLLCSVTNADDDAVVADVSVFDAEGVERAHETASLDPAATATVGVKPGRVHEPFACRVTVAKAGSVRVSLCREVELTSGEVLASCVPGR